MYIFSWAIVTVYIYMVTVAHLSLKIILFIWHKNFFFALFFSLSSHWAHQRLSRVSASLSLFHSWVLPLIFSLHLLLINFCSFSSPLEIIMWSVWGFCSPVRRVDQLTDFGANFSKKVWVFLIELLGFFCFFVSSKILGSFSKLIFFRFSCFKFFLVWCFF